MNQVIHEIRLPGKYASFGFQNLFRSNVQKMYTELKAQQIEAAATQAEADKKQKPPNRKQ